MTKTILILGAGRSSASLIRYLLTHAPAHNWRVVVGDLSESAALEKIGDSAYGSFQYFNILEGDASAGLIASGDVVISLLPAALHPLVAKMCLKHRKHLLTASYVSDDMASLHSEAVASSLLFLNECGLDPGIDHMSAMQVIDRIRRSGGKLTTFESFTGGLIAPETDPENPWRYKFTWNPRNVVMAGQGTARYLHNGRVKFIPYQRLFRTISTITVSGYGDFEGYANRDSLQYVTTYGLADIKTMLRGTLRNKGFCAAWDVLVQLGCCDDSYKIEGVASMTHGDFLQCFLPDNTNGIKESLRIHLGASDDVIERLDWSGFFSNEPIGLEAGSPALITEHILNKRWQLSTTDRDMIVMQHRFGYELNGKEHCVHSSLVARGDNATYTAMAKTVGLPLAIATRLLLTGRISLRGVVIPTMEELYGPILEELVKEGIELDEEELTN